MEAADSPGRCYRSYDIECHVWKQGDGDIGDRSFVHRKDIGLPWRYAAFRNGPETSRCEDIEIDGIYLRYADCKIHVYGS